MPIGESGTWQYVARRGGKCMQGAGLGEEKKGRRGGGGSYFDRLGVSAPFVSELLLVSVLFVGAGRQAVMFHSCCLC